MDKAFVLRRLEEIDSRLSAHETQVIEALSSIHAAKREVLELIETLQD